MKSFSILTALIFLMYSHEVSAQGDTTEEKARPQFKLSINYNSGLNYFGRVDSLRSSGVFPMAELWLSNNFYINAAPIFVNNNLQKLDYAGTVASAGFQNVSDKWISNLSVLKPFYEESSRLVQSALKAQANISLTRLNKVANITLGGDVKFSDRIDYGATAGLDHLIRKTFGDGSVIVFDPGVYAYAGTQNFTHTYNRKRSDFLLFPGNNQQVTESVQKFSILAYEVTVPVVYVKGKVQLLATPSYIIPQNLIKVPNRPDQSEFGENMFYSTLSLKYSF